MKLPGIPRRTPLVMQAEAADCGLACLLMVAGHHGRCIDLAVARERHPTSLRGASLPALLRIGAALDLAPRPMRLEPAQLGELKLPCLLHWDFRHYVVLTALRHGRADIHDPAYGARTLPMAELSRHFTGVAIELTPTPSFTPESVCRRVGPRAILGDLSGIGSGIAGVLALALTLQLLVIAAPLQIQWVVDGALATRDNDLVAVLGLGFGLLVAAQVALTALRAWLLGAIAARLKLQMMTRLFTHLLRLPVAWFQKRQTGDVTSRFESLDQIQAGLTTSAIESIVDGVMAIATLAMMFGYSVRLSLIVIAAAIASMLARLLLHSPIRRASEMQIVSRARQQSHFIETVRGVQCVKLFGAETERRRVWRNRVVEQFNAALRTQRLALSAQAANGLVSGLAGVVIVCLGARLVLDGGSFVCRAF